MFLFRRTRPDLYLSHYVGKNNFHEMLADAIKAKIVTISNLEIKFANGSKIHGCHCFTGDTLISTTEGDRPISSMVGTSGKVNISSGNKALFENVRKTRADTEIITVSFDDGSSIRCTPDHKFLTVGEYCEAKDLRGEWCKTTNSKHRRCVDVRPAGREDVYCLTVPEYGFFALANGVLVSNCEYEKDVYNYKSVEMHGRILEETTEFTPFQIQYLGTRARFPEDLLKGKDIPDWMLATLPMALYPTNFDDQGGSKEYLCELFKVYENWNSENRYKPTKIWTAGKTATSTGKTRQYIPALLDDNPSINKEAYTASLMELRHPEMVRSLLEGDPTVQMGALWPELSRAKNVLTEHLEPPKHYTQLYAHDWGGYSPAATVWACLIGDEGLGPMPRGAVYIYKYRLIAQEKDRAKGLEWSNGQIAEDMYRLEPQHNISYLSDTLPFRALGGKPMWKEYADCIAPGVGIRLKKADVSSKEVSTQAVRSLIVGRDGVTDFYISPECDEVFRTMALMRPHPNHPEKPADHKEDHLPDCVQHICRAWKTVRDAAKPTAERRRLELEHAKEIWEQKESLLDIDSDLKMLFND